MISLNPYLSFGGNAEEALNFYKGIFGGELVISRFADTPGMPIPEGMGDKVMHGDLTTDAIRLYGSDVPDIGGIKPGENVTLALSGDDDAVLTGYFEGLSEGGDIREPLKAAPWGDKFGMLKDKYNIVWMVNISAPHA